VHREEGGTPAIIESIRAGLVFQLKEAVGHELIRERETSYIRRAIAAWSQHPRLGILGNRDAWRLSIVSFVVRHGEGYLHHNFVVALLNDLFGIQARGGCSCAGPYGHRLLGIDFTTSKSFESEIVAGCEGIKPGWVRVNFNYFISEAQFDFLIRAVELVAEHGWKLLPLYDFDPITGQWRHQKGRPDPAMRLSDVTYRAGKLEYRSRRATEPEWVLPGYLEDAKKVFAQAEQDLRLAPFVAEPRVSANFQRLRWFPLPNEVLCELKGVESPTRCAHPGHAHGKPNETPPR
jgi:hypothetical protein